MAGKHGKELIHEMRVPQPAGGFAPHRLFCFRMCERRLVRTCRGERVVHVHGLKYTRQQRDIVPGEPVGVAGSVPMLVMMADYGEHTSKRFQRTTDGFAGYGMLL